MRTLGTTTVVAAHAMVKRSDRMPTSRFDIVYLHANPYPAYTGGIETWLTNMLERQDRRGLRVAVIAPATDAAAKHRLEHLENVTVLSVRLPAWRIAGAPIPIRGLQVTAAQLIWITRVARLLFRMEQPAAVVALDPLPCLLGVVPLRIRRRRPRIVCSVRGLEWRRLGTTSMSWLQHVHASISRVLLRTCDTVHANGTDTASALLDDLGVGSIVIPNGVDLERFGARHGGGPADVDEACLASDVLLQELVKRREQGNINVLNVGTLRPVKGIEYIIRGAAALRTEAGPTVLWWLVGKGDQQPWRELAERLGVSDVVRFVGERTCVRCYLHAADIGLAVSGGGGVSNALVEQLAAGLPTIALDGDTQRPILGNGGALLVDPADPASLAGAVLELRADRQRRMQLHAAALSLASQYDINAIEQRFTALVLDGLEPS